LHAIIVALEGRVQDLEARWREHALRLDREIQSKVEYAVLDLLSSRQSVAPQHAPSSTAAAALQAQYMGALPTLSHTSAFHQDAGSLLGGMTNLPPRAERGFGSDAVVTRNPNLGGMGWDSALSQAAAANASIAASINGKADGTSPPTLPPHPKQKSIPPPPFQGQQGGASERRLSERLTQGMGLHQNILAGAGGLVGGGLPPASASNPSMLLRNAWEDKFFSTLMMQDGASRAASLAGLAAHNGIVGTVGGGSVVGGPSLAALAAVQHMQQQQQQQGQHHHGLGGHHQQHAAVAQAYMQRMNGNAQSSLVGGDAFKRLTELDNGHGTKVDKSNAMVGAEEEV
jgi:hypothetical protein